MSLLRRRGSCGRKGPEGSAVQFIHSNDQIDKHITALRDIHKVIALTQWNTQLRPPEPTGIHWTRPSTLWSSHRDVDGVNHSRMTDKTHSMALE